METLQAKVWHNFHFGTVVALTLWEGNVFILMTQQLFYTTSI